MRWREALQDETVRRVAEIRAYSDNMRESLGKAVADFCDFLQVDSPTAAIAKLRGLGDQELVKIFRDYYISRKQSLSPKTIVNWSSAVKVWLFENEFNMDAISRAITREFHRYVASRGVPKILKRDIIEREDIRRLLLTSDIRTRALIATLASSGLRVGVSGLRLQIKHFRDNLFEEKECYMLEIPEELTKAERGMEIPHITFISREARDFILTYLQQRRSKGERIDEESYLFVSHHSNGGRTLSEERPQPLTYNGALHLWLKACEAAGIDRRPVTLKRGGQEMIRYNIRFHSLRKYFKTACSIAGVDRVATEAMLGHSLTQFGIESVYDYCITNLAWLRSQYMKALPLLTFLMDLPPGVQVVNGEARRKAAELENRITQLQEEFDYLKTILTSLLAAKRFTSPSPEKLIADLKKLAKTLTIDKIPVLVDTLISLSLIELPPHLERALYDALTDAALAIDALAKVHGIGYPQAELLIRRMLEKRQKEI